MVTQFLRSRSWEIRTTFGAMGDGVRVGELCSPHGVGPVCQFARVLYLRMHEDLEDRFR